MTVNLRPSSLVDAMHDALRMEILTGRIPAGEPLTEVDLASRYSVARPTAKAAVERLVHEGLLTRASNKSARVPVLSISDVRDLYYSRGVLEREIMSALCTRRFVPPAAYRSLTDMRSLSDDPAITEVVAADIALHRSLAEALHSPRLSRLYESLIGEVHLCMAQVQAHHLLEPRRIADEHTRILSAIEAGDETRAIEEINSHLDRACTRLVGYLEGRGTRRQ